VNKGDDDDDDENNNNNNNIFFQTLGHSSRTTPLTAGASIEHTGIT